MTAKNEETLNDSNQTTSCCHKEDSSCTPNNIGRRNFLIYSAASVTALGAYPGMQAMAGPFKFTNRDKQHLIPEDKKLSQQWVASLFSRGRAERYTGAELDYIGMPIGGVACGQLYLGGDGRLWLWDIFKNQYHRETGHDSKLAAMTLGGHYAHPLTPENSITPDNGAHVDQGFAIRINNGTKPVERYLDIRGFAPEQISFRGEYPMGKINYNDSDLPIDISLQAHTPFIPLKADDSSMPVVLFRWSLKNRSNKRLQVDLSGYLENAVCPYDRSSRDDLRGTEILSDDNLVVLHHGVQGARGPQVNSGTSQRKDILIADFDDEKFAPDWTVDGDAFANGPVSVDFFDKGGNLDWNNKIKGALGAGIAMSFDGKQSGKTAMGSVQVAPFVGRLISPIFNINRRFLSFLVAGDLDTTVAYVAIYVGGKLLTKVGGKNNHFLQRKHIDLRAYQGQQVKIEIVDEFVTDNVPFSRRRGTILVDDIRLTDKLPAPAPLESLHGYGSMALALIGDYDSSHQVHVGEAETLNLADMFGRDEKKQANAVFTQRPVGALTAHLDLAPGESKDINFAISWYFPDYNEKDFGELLEIKDFDKLRRHYADRFRSANDVVEEVVQRWSELVHATDNWNHVWYDSTLPYWLLDRSFISMNCLASKTVIWFNSKRFYGWEGVDCCPGTCTHVWQYAQGMARVFPELERGLRTDVDYGIGYNQNGLIGHRAEIVNTEATDGQCGTIMRVYREHQMSADSQFLRAIWSKVKQSFKYLAYLDQNGDSLLEGEQHNTLDAYWTGEISWISSLYLGAAAACIEMANDLNDKDFAAYCRKILTNGRKALVKVLFNGEYFIHKPDPKYPELINTNQGCHIDQVLGQSFAWQMGIDERIVPEEETLLALNSLWKYNFSLDAGGYSLAHREIEAAFRWYAMEGEAGLLMTTWPMGGAIKAIPGSKLRSKQNPKIWTGPGGYFNECMNGFEYQAASHMIYEGKPNSELVKRGLAVTKAVHERYAAKARNPYNEIECSDHYSRSMASYGVFLAACGFEYHGPRGHIGFAPKLSPDNFKAAFIAAEGWGSYSQQIQDGVLNAMISLLYGQLVVNRFRFQLASKLENKTVKDIHIDDKKVRFEQQGTSISVYPDSTMTVDTGEKIQIQIQT